MTYDVAEVKIEETYKFSESEIKMALKDESYLNRETLLKVCRLRDSLKIAYQTIQEINNLMK